MNKLSHVKRLNQSDEHPVQKNIRSDYSIYFKRIPYDGIFMTDDYNVTDEFIQDYFADITDEVKDFIKGLTFTWDNSWIDYCVDWWFPFSQHIADNIKDLVKAEFKTCAYPR